MKILLISFALLFPHINQAQTKPSSRIKKPIIKSTNSIALKHDKPIEKLMIGDTCYVTTANLPLRGRPTAATPGVIQLRHNTKVAVQEIVNNQWILLTITTKMLEYEDMYLGNVSRAKRLTKYIGG